MTIDIARIRNVGFVGHGGVGKTSLVEAILFRNGMTSRLGRVDDGTATTDFDPEEIKRKISINIGVAYCDYRDHRFHFVDMPGIRRLHRRGARRAPRRRGRGDGGGRGRRCRGPDGEGLEVRPGVRAPAAGLRQPHGSRASRLRPHPRVDPAAAQGPLRPAPRAHGPGGGVPRAGGRPPDEGLRAGDAPGKFEETAIPADLADAAQATREKLVEAVAETDDDLLARYLEEGTLDEAEVVKALRAAIGGGQDRARDPAGPPRR